jgi:hypothetical protein
MWTEILEFDRADYCSIFICVNALWLLTLSYCWRFRISDILDASAWYSGYGYLAPPYSRYVLCRTRPAAARFALSPRRLTQSIKQQARLSQASGHDSRNGLTFEKLLSQERETFEKLTSVESSYPLFHRSFVEVAHSILQTGCESR